MRKVQCLLLVSILAAGCASNPQVIVVTATPEPTEAASPTLTPLPSFTPEPTSTPRPTWTPRPSNTPTLTVEPRDATQTSQAVVREATRAYNQHIDEIRKACPVIEWVELSEVQYARDHEGDCVYIKGRVSNVNFDEELLDLSIGYYSASIAVGIGNLTSTPGRLTDDMWINVYGTVCIDCWVSVNQFTGDKTSIPGLMARLIEGPNGLIWVRE